MAQASDSQNSRPTREEVVGMFEGLSRRGPAQLLGVPLNADGATARTAFLVLARRYHPDVLLPQDHDLRDQVQAIFIALDQACRHFGGHRSGRLSPKPAPAPQAEPGAPAPSSTAASATAATPAGPAPAARVVPARPQKTEIEAAKADAARAQAERARAEEAEAEARARVEQLLLEAEAAVRRGEAGAAVSVLQAVPPTPDGAVRRRTRLLLARAYVSDPHWRRYGLDLLQEMAEGPEPDSGALRALAELYAREGRLARAEAALAKAIELDPGEQAARRELQRIREVRALQAAARPPTRKAGLLERLRSMTR